MRQRFTVRCHQVSFYRVPAMICHSFTLPLSMTKTRSLSMIVFKRCATVMHVAFLNSVRNTRWIRASVSASTDAVASSMMTMLAPVSIARAMTINWRLKRRKLRWLTEHVKAEMKLGNVEVLTARLRSLFLLLLLDLKGIWHAEHALRPSFRFPRSWKRRGWAWTKPFPWQHKGRHAPKRRKACYLRIRLTNRREKTWDWFRFLKIFVS